MVEGRLKGRVVSIAPKFERKLERPFLPSYMKGWFIRFDVEAMHWRRTKSSQADSKTLIMDREKFSEI